MLEGVGGGGERGTATSNKPPVPGPQGTLGALPHPVLSLLMYRTGRGAGRECGTMRARVRWGGVVAVGGWGRWVWADVAGSSTLG